MNSENKPREHSFLKIFIAVLVSTTLVISIFGFWSMVENNIFTFMPNRVILMAAGKVFSLGLSLAALSDNTIVSWFGVFGVPIVVVLSISILAIFVYNLITK